MGPGLELRGEPLPIWGAAHPGAGLEVLRPLCVGGQFSVPCTQVVGTSSAAPRAARLPLSRCCDRYTLRGRDLNSSVPPLAPVFQDGLQPPGTAHLCPRHAWMVETALGFPPRQLEELPPLPASWVPLRMADSVGEERTTDGLGLCRPEGEDFP